jgi:hypothetical protein
MRSNRVFSILLIIVMLAAFTSSTPNAVSQSLTTVTTYGLSTDSLSVPPTYGQYACVYQYLTFQLSKDSQVESVIDSSGPVDFAFMTNAQLEAWIQNESCDVNSALVNVQEITHYALSYTVANDGTYGYLFLNKDESSSASVTYSYPTQVTHTLTVTPSLLDLATGGTGMLIIVAVAIVIVALTAYFVGVRRGRTPATMAQPQPELVTQPAAGHPGVKFCANCGAKLPAVAQFCNSCGTKQP